MKLVRSGLAALSIASALGAVGCHHGKQDLSEAQLTALLRTEDSHPNDAKAPLDPKAVNCLRAWSGDADIAKGLSMVAVSDKEKAACRPLIALWLADKSRNPEGARFEDASSPANVRRAMRLLSEHSTATAHVPAVHAESVPVAVAPRTLGNPPPAPPSSAAAEAALGDLDDVCRQMKKQKAAGKVSTMQARYADTCDARIEQLRSRYAQLSQNSESTEAALFARQVQNYAAMARKMTTGTPPPPKNN